jgi:hypothetical protein
LNTATANPRESDLCPLLPDAEITQDADGQIVIYTGLTIPREST